MKRLICFMLLAYFINEGICYSLEVPGKHGNIQVSCQDYNTRLVALRGPYWRGPVDISISRILNQSSLNSRDSVWSGINVLSFLPFELITGSIGLQYERFLQRNHTIGLHASSYLFGWGYSMNNQKDATNQFTGIKVSSFYRYYVRQSADFGFFLEGKLIFGYFDMHPLLYRHNVSSELFGIDYVTIEKDLNFWTFGGGLAVGWAIRMPEKKNGIFNLSIGCQYFPILAPAQYTSQSGLYEGTSFEINNTWWYLGGPGSVIQVKVAYGGIF